MQEYRKYRNDQKALVLYFMYLALKIKSLLYILLQNNQHDLDCTWFSLIIYFTYL